MVGAAKRALTAEGCEISRVPGRGLSNIWDVSRGGKVRRAAIRTTRDHWIAFQPLQGGSRWKTLDDVEEVVVAAVDSKEEPESIEVYVFPAGEVRSRFDEAYAARAKEGQANRNGYGMWVGLDRDDRGLAASVGSGILERYRPIAVYQIADLLDEQSPVERVPEPEAAEPELPTIAEVMAWARERVAEIAGVRPEAVRLDLKIEY